MPKSHRKRQHRRNAKSLEKRNTPPPSRQAASSGDTAPPVATSVQPTFRQVIFDLCRNYLPHSTSVLIQTYTTARKSDYIVNGPSRMMSVHGRWIVVAGKSTISYVQASGIGFQQDQFDIQPGDTAMLNMSASALKSGPKYHVSVIAPIQANYGEDVPNTLNGAREVIREATALAAVTFGDSFIDQRLYENVLDLETLKAHLSDADVSLTIGIATVQGNYDDTGRADMIAVGTAIANLDTQRQRLVTLGLRWFDRSRVSDGPLPYLFRWLALNSLTLSIQANDPVNGVGHLLSKAYGITEEQAKEEFSIGRLYGLRGRIAHGQADTATTAQQELVRAMFRDALMASVNLECRSSARAAIAIYGPPFQ